jgi:hypothetical protein
MIKQNETHDKIVQVLEEKGPSLPIQISKEIGMSSLFISAFLSELTNEKRINVSHLKVGGSPLYFLNGQEEQLENFYKFLHPKEAETFLLLKTHKILKDSEQEPAIRVALRSIRDYSVGFKKDEEIYWRYILVPESEINDILRPPKKKDVLMPDSKEEDISTPDLKIKENPKPKIIKKQIQKTEIPKTEQKPKVQEEFQNPLAVEETVKPKKQKQKSDFVEKVIEKLNKYYQIIQEKDYKAKEYNCLIQINSDLGPINFLTQAKDKKSVSETDLKKLLATAQSIPLPALFIYTGNLSKKAQEYAEQYASILKVLKID